jgi:hypothetical protein
MKSDANEVVRSRCAKALAYLAHFRRKINDI